MKLFNLEKFINEKVIKRTESMFLNDIKFYESSLKEKTEDKSVLVIGGAGSIGSSFIRALLKYAPKSLVVVDTNENTLAELTRDLRSRKELKIPDEYLTYPMDFSSPVFVKMFKNRKGFDLVANFSAHKHVRSEKDIYSVEALLQNNVIKAKALLELLKEYPPEEYFCVSTDKAANPVNIMGASKRIMEDMIFSYSEYYPVKTARFANVAFSNGSLPAGFLERLDKIQPITAPSDVKRYFVSPEESGQICLLACLLGNNREIFFPKLEEAAMMTFDKIAEELIRHRGFDIEYCGSEAEVVEKCDALKNRIIAMADFKNIKESLKYPVYFSKSDTSGEKAFEEFYIEGENINLNRFVALGVIEGKEIPDRERVVKFTDGLKIMFEKEETKKEDVVKYISDYLPSFKHIETGKGLDSKL
ncbi:polysaccharide biosynthesis protein [Catonella morbi ATCC 51271]|uniref:Polysaccharide biosynthesis protein n=1 Tax=Catonella morbi ATCC 51271 TaxID=592026 RepID=V2Y7C5_9FIRM|nr:polysaccharide biosynthesis protein [Catonella morbi]ESL03997.1 polysaccharide biosynthesis protein [Catonella morbi ATCC 51271]